MLFLGVTIMITSTTNNNDENVVIENPGTLHPDRILPKGEMDLQPVTAKPYTHFETSADCPSDDGPFPEWKGR